MTTSRITSLTNALLSAATRDERDQLATIKSQAVDVFEHWLVYDAPDPTGPQPRGKIAQIVADALPDLDRIVLALLSDHAQLLEADATVSARDIEQTLIGWLKDDIVNGTDGLAKVWAMYCEEPRGVW
jgi:hypothetical protein